MPTVDFIYDKDCPNVETARANLMRAFSRAEVPAHWQEHQIGSADAPAHVKGFGSPTILVDRVDVDGLDAGVETCCRIYKGGGAPSIELIADALKEADNEATPGRATPATPRHRWKSTAGTLPGIGIALLPKITCPLCWPAYAGVLSTVGLSFLMEDRWLFPISAIFLLAALAALAWRARSRRGYSPLALGAMSAAAILVGKFAMDATAIVHIGLATMVAACIWNAWPRRRIEPNCSACTSTTIR